MRKLVLLLFFPAAIFCDTVILRNGNILEGKILSHKKQTVIIQIPYGTLKIHQKDIKEIKRTSEISNLLFQGERLLYHKRFKLALEQFNRAVKIDSEDKNAKDKLIEAQLTYAEFLNKVKRYNDALSVLKGVTSEDINNKKALEKIKAIKKIQSEYIPRVLQAQNLLEERNFKFARDQYQYLWENYPDKHKYLRQPIACAEAYLGNAELNKSAFNKAAHHYEQALVYYPDYFPKLVNRYTYAQANIAKALINNKKYKDAEKILRRSLEFCPRSESLRYLLGCTLQNMGHFQEAISFFEDLNKNKKKQFNPKKSLALHAKLARDESLGKVPTHIKAKSSHFTTVKTKHFHVLCPDRGQGKQIADALEFHFNDLAPRFSLKKFLKPCEVIIYATKADYHKKTGTADWSDASSTWNYKFERLFSHHIYSFQNCPQLLSCKLRHELTHILLAAYLNYQKFIPLWANEGVAISSEPAFKHRYYNEIVLQAAYQKQLLPVKDVLSNKIYPDDDDVKLYYAQSYSLTHYLITKIGFKRFLSFLKDIGTVNDWKVWQKYMRFNSSSQVESNWKRKAIDPFLRGSLGNLKSQ